MRLCVIGNLMLPLHMQKIFLIGYMGSGKTTIGKRLAKDLGLQFIDLDAFIENRYRKSILEIFTEKGEINFREIEKKALLEVVQFENTVVSTGGGAPCFFDNMSVMNEVGTTIYLEASIDELSERLSVSKEKRPLLQDKNPEELKAFIGNTLEKRKPFYNQATYIYNTQQIKNSKELDTIVNHLIQYLSKQKSDIHENNS
jgi:shikimate kinase